MDEPREKACAALGEAYISGALTALDDGPRTKLFYELLAEIAEAAGLRAYLPHRVTDPVAAAHLDPRSVYEIHRAPRRGAPVATGGGHRTPAGRRARRRDCRRDPRGGPGWTSLRRRPPRSCRPVRPARRGPRRVRPARRPVAVAFRSGRHVR